MRNQLTDFLLACHLKELPKAILYQCFQKFNQISLFSKQDRILVHEECFPLHAQLRRLQTNQMQFRHNFPGIQTNQRFLHANGFCVHTNDFPQHANQRRFQENQKCLGTNIFRHQTNQSCLHANKKPVSPLILPLI